MAEDFTTYTKVDPGNRFTVAKRRISIAALPGNETAYVYKDFGAGFFAGDFSFNVDFGVASYTGGSSQRFYPFVLSNSVGDERAIEVATGDSFYVLVYHNAAGYNIYLGENVGGTVYEAYSSTVFRPVAHSTVFLTVRRNAAVGTYGTLYCDIYADYERTDLIMTLTLTLHAVKSFRYRYGVTGFNIGSTDTITGYAKSPPGEDVASAVFSPVGSSIIRGLS